MTDRSTPHLRTTRPHNLCNYKSSRPSLTRIASASPNSSWLSSETNHTRMVGVHMVVLERYTSRSLGMRNQSPSLAASLEQARTSWQLLMVLKYQF